MKKIVSIMLALTTILALSVTSFADEVNTFNNDNADDVVCVEVFEIDDNQQVDVQAVQPRKSLYSGLTMLSTSSIKTLWNSSNYNMYKTVSCYNYGDSDTGSGAVRFTVNGVSQDVAAGSGATFSIPTGQYVTISAKALWYDGSYNLSIVGSVL